LLWALTIVGCALFWTRPRGPEILSARGSLARLPRGNSTRIGEKAAASAMSIARACWMAVCRRGREWFNLLAIHRIRGLIVGGHGVPPESCCRLDRASWRPPRLVLAPTSPWRFEHQDRVVAGIEPLLYASNVVYASDLSTGTMTLYQHSQKRL